MSGAHLALVAAVVFLGGMLVERLLLQLRPNAYFTAGFPLTPELVPMQRAPTALAGQTASIRWERQDDLVRFWSDPAARTAPMGLHGAVRLWNGPRGVHMVVRWSPPWSPLLAAAWFAGLGIVRHEAVVTLPLACLLILGILYVYRTFALKAAAELRWAWVSGRDDDPGAPSTR
jgi:hypothetical protein